MDKYLLLYIILQLLNVISCTLKYVVTVKGKTWAATLVNAINYAISSYATILMVRQEEFLAVVIVFLSNIVGVPIGKWVVKKITPDRLWIYTATIYCTGNQAKKIRKFLKEKRNIHSNYQEINEDEIYSFSIYAEDKNQSHIIKDLLTKLPRCKYHITEAL